MRELSVILMSLILLGGCHKSTELLSGQSANKQQLQKITVAYTNQPQTALIHIAMAKGFFVDEGLDVQPLMHTYGKAALQSVIDNRADIATVAETPIMFSVLNGAKITVIADITSSTTDNAILARKDAGIVSAADLKGKRIAYTPGTTSEFFLDSLLTANGITMQDIVTVPLKPDELTAAILDKKVDAVSTWNYLLEQLSQQLGQNGRVFYDHDIYTEIYNVVTMKEFTDKNPETIRRFLRALIKAEKYIVIHPQESQDIMTADTGTDKNIVHKVWNVFNFHVVLDQMLVITLEDETRWAMKNKLTQQTVMPNYLNYINTDSLRSVSPDVVKITR